MNANPQTRGWILIGGWALFAKNALDPIDPAKTVVISFDALEPEWSYLESGKCAVLIAQDVHGWGYKSVDVLLHLIDPASGQYDASVLGKSLPGLDFVVIEWARRQQGLIVAPGNPAKIGSVTDLHKKGVRVATRQEGSGSALLFSKLVADAGLALDDLEVAGQPVSSETDIAVAVRDGKADAGLAIEAVAREQGLDFLPLQWERFDLVVRRVEYFEPPLQRLFAFCRTEPFQDRAASLGGYDVSKCGSVVFNARR